MSDQVFTTSEIAHITGFSLRQLDYWALHSIIVPDIQQSLGPGTRKLYSTENVIQLQIVKRLKSFGWSTQKIRTAIDRLREVMTDPDPLKKAILIHNKNTIIALCKTKAGERIILDALSSTGQQVMPIVLEMLMEEILQLSETLELVKG